VSLFYLAHNTFINNMIMGFSLLFKQREKPRIVIKGELQLLGVSRKEKIKCGSDSKKARQKYPAGIDEYLFVTLPWRYIFSQDWNPPGLRTRI